MLTTKRLRRLRWAATKENALIDNYVRLDSGLVRRRGRGAQVPCLNGPLVRACLKDPEAGRLTMKRLFFLLMLALGSLAVATVTKAVSSRAQAERVPRSSISSEAQAKTREMLDRGTRSACARELTAF